MNRIHRNREIMQKVRQIQNKKRDLRRQYINLDIKLHMIIKEALKGKYEART